MKPRTQELFERTEANHDFLMGQPFSHGGTKMSRTDTCQVCGLARIYLTDPQNGIEEQYRYRTYDAREEDPDLPLLEIMHCTASRKSQ
jgi:hypothetical protein